jgi:uncharacterized protein YecE (DUF72 family)
MTAQVRIGCSGWVYKHWRGVFYPKDLAQKRWFEFYSAEFDTVEINATFYRLQRASTFDKWRTQAPRDFLYAVKASRFITHMKKLKDMTGSETPSEAVGRLAYLRFHGTGGKYHGRYGEAQLRHYAEWLLKQRKAGRHAYAYFNNDIHGHAIEDARTLKSMVQRMRG